MRDSGYRSVDEVVEDAKARATAWGEAISTTLSTGNPIAGFIAGCRKSKEVYDRLDEERRQRSRDCTCDEE